MPPATREQTIDWSRLDGHRFQALCLDLLTADGFAPLDQGVGPDGGIDIIATQNVVFQHGYTKVFTWAVQAKYRATPTATVRPLELGNIKNLLVRFTADGYLLITNGKVTAKAFAEIRAVTETGPPSHLAHVWDNRIVESKVLRNRDLLRRYFGASSERSVLIVEDDLPWLQIMTRALSGLGHTVLAARSTSEASAILREHDIDAAIIDIYLGEEGTGFDVAEELRKTNPGATVIFNSGYLGTSEFRSRASAMNAVTVSKFSANLDSLITVLTDALKTPSPIREAAARHDSVAAIVAATAHSVANSLGAVRVLNRDVGERECEKIDHLLQKAMASIDSLRSAVYEGKLLARSERVVVDVWAIVKRAVDLALMTHEGANLDLVEPAVKLSVPCVAQGIEAAIGALVDNAIEAGLERGSPTIRVETRRVERDRSYVAIAVQDKGAGIPQQLRARLYQPGFTTKPRGNGLGFFLANQVIEYHDGWIQIESPAGDWATCVTAYLPLRDASG